MSFAQVYLARDEMEASIIKGNLESVDIKSVISPVNNNSPLNGSWLTVQDIQYAVYVEEDKAEEAMKVLEESK